MLLYLVRHGESKGNVNRGFIAGRSDTQGLTIKGRVQVTRAAWELRENDFWGVVTSPVVRARESADIIGTLFNRPVVEAEFLQEMSYGTYEGTLFWDNLDEKRHAFERWNSDPYYAFPEGESIRDIASRVWEGMEAYKAEYFKNPAEYGNGRPTVLVAHDAIISTLLFQFQYGYYPLDTAPKSYVKSYVSFLHEFDVPNASIHKVAFSKSAFAKNKIQSTTVSRLDRHRKPVAQNNTSISFYAKGVLEIPAVSIEEKMTQSENMVFKLKAAKETVILKVMSEREIVSFARLERLYGYLTEKTDLKVPQIKLRDNSFYFFELPVIVQDYVSGDELGYFLKRNTCRRTILERVHETVRKIHAIPATDVAGFWYPNDLDTAKIHLPWGSYMTNEIELCLSKMRYIAPQPELKKKIQLALRRLLEDISKLEDYQLVPLHGDLSLSNIVLTHDNAYIRILDFERARIGDPLWDMAYFMGNLQRQQAPAAILWNQMVTENLSREDVKRYYRYCLLFHVWTIRDSETFKKNSMRQKKGQASLLLLDKVLNLMASG